MLVGFLASYVLRGATSFVEGFLRRACHACVCGRGVAEAAVLASERGLSWREAKARLDATDDFQLNVLAALRLVFWHWMQPAAYVLLLYGWSDDPYFRSRSDFQVVMAIAVLVREVLYFGCTVLALVRCPAFLLVDVIATWRSGARGEAFASVMMPEKFLGWYLQGAVPSQAASRRFNSYCCAVLLLDGCSFLALWACFAGWTARPPVPIMVCYGITTLSLVAIPSWAFAIIAARAIGILPENGAQGRRSTDALDVPLGRLPTSE